MDNLLNLLKMEVIIIHLYSPEGYSCIKINKAK